MNKNCKIIRLNDCKLSTESHEDKSIASEETNSG